MRDHLATQMQPQAPISIGSDDREADREDRIKTKTEHFMKRGVPPHTAAHWARCEVDEELSSPA